MIRIAALVLALAAAPAAAADNEAFQCNTAADLARTFYDARRQGVTEEQAREQLAAHDLGRFGYVASIAFRTPSHVGKTLVANEAFTRCEQMRRDSERRRK